MYIDFATSALPKTEQKSPPVAAMARVNAAWLFRVGVLFLNTEKVFGICFRKIFRKTRMMSLLWSFRLGGAEQHDLLSLLGDGEGARDFLSKYFCMDSVKICIDDGTVCSWLGELVSTKISLAEKSVPSNQNGIF